MEKLLTNYKCYLKTKSSNIESFITFTKANVSIKHSTYKLKKKTKYTMMATKTQNKHLERQKLRKGIIKTTLELKYHI